MFVIVQLYYVCHRSVGNTQKSRASEGYRITWFQGTFLRPSITVGMLLSVLVGGPCFNQGGFMGKDRSLLICCYVPLD